MPVKINDKLVAMFVSPSKGMVFLKNSNYMNFDKNINKEMSQDSYIFDSFNAEEKSWIVNVDKFSFGGFEVKNAKFMLMKGELNESIDGIPIIGIVGNIVLKNFAVLYDMPHKNIVFYDVEYNFDNDNEIKNIIGGDFYQVYIDNYGDWTQVDVNISGHRFPFYINADTDETEVPMRIIRKYNIPIRDDEENKEVSWRDRRTLD